ncbi:MAG: 4-hydroxybenzoate octaprenyltransferase [Rhodospirillales bacterium]|nr:4-hydroxybenzoate octaprenyltransferase [Rhodospirillales bacterium]
MMQDMSEFADSASDIRTDDWIDRYVPIAARPYFRLARVDRPIGTWLLLLPCWWGLALAAPEWVGLYLAALFAIGSLVMRAAGCTINDMVDREFDRKVARTAKRPVASGAISLFAAGAFLGALLLVGLLILLQFNSFTIWLGIAALPLVAAYPFMKRFTYWPQAWLGLTFNWGVLMGWAAVQGELAWAPVLLYAAGFFWTLGYDTIYAHQDKDDDLLVGVKSSALKLGGATRPWLFGFYGMTVVLMGGAGILADLGWPYFAFLAGGAIHLGIQAWRIDTGDPKDCLKKFKSNRDFGLIVAAGIIAAQATT